jgi:hypothetical protein
MTVTKVDAHTFHLGQQRYIEDVLQKYGMIDCHSTHVPFTGDPVSKLDCPDLEPGKNPLQKKYVELIGILRWIERCTRPDLTVALSELGKVQANPGQVHWKKLHSICCATYRPLAKADCCTALPSPTKLPARS